MSTMSPGARRNSVKITIDMPSSVRRAMTSRWTTYVFTRSPSRSSLLVAPHFLHPAEVVDGLVRDQVLHVRPDGEEVDLPVQDRPRGVGLELLLDRDVERQPLLRVQLLRLRLEQLHGDRKSTRLNSSHGYISYAVFCLKKKKKDNHHSQQRHLLDTSIHYE